MAYGAICYGMCGTDMAYGAICYGMCGTDMAYGGRVVHLRRQLSPRKPGSTLTMLLRACYAVSGTTRGTERAYGGTRAEKRGRLKR
eukprot:2845485-Rhodomonas_salina.1